LVVEKVQGHVNGGVLRNLCGAAADKVLFFPMARQGGSAWVADMPDEERVVEAVRKGLSRRGVVRDWWASQSPRAGGGSWY
jgi:uncharacterized membrane protein YdjX (TVP38/TMEM64 family)